VSDSSSDGDSDLAVNNDDGDDTVMNSTSNTTCDSLSEAEEGMYSLGTEYFLLTNLNKVFEIEPLKIQKGLDVTNDNPCFITFRFITARCIGDNQLCSPRSNTMA